MKTNQIGRSMIEMLGVLAIIGVLSVGAIAGYSKAMFKQKMNKTMDILSHAVNRVAELDTMKLGNFLIEYGTEDVVKYDIMPDCDVNYVDMNGEKGASCPLPLGEIRFILSSGITGEFYISFTKQAFDSCVAFLSSNIYKNVPDDWWTPVCDGCSGGVVAVNDEAFYGKSETWLSQGAKSNPTNQDILEACEPCKDTNYCQIYWVIRNEI